MMETTYPVESPTLESAHEALRRLYGPHTEDLWKTLLFSAGLTGDETDPGSFGRMVVSMQAATGVTQLCGRALAMRAATFKRLTAAPTEVTVVRAAAPEEY
ncbi:hypothetical protein [Paractinoplanes durhamensis]|uniref:Uncharacterized protein n=1 Tax=Paractinoplanes durhamensis TaxID=113563 RepID=A0ABQ3Z8G5_9ACTN|nr:hypothetical protein [Actinoplanes durhamensis]GIE06115.1 hypothetical protein Adu01nite_74650 [Actinoplanes durhamensis]